MCLAIVGAVIVLSTATAAVFDKRPRITTHPKSVKGVAGSEVVLFAGACSAGAPIFQWLRDGAPVPGANEPVLRLKPLSDRHVGDYRVVIATAYGKATSDVAQVSLDTSGGFTPELAVFTVCAVGYVNLGLKPGFTLVVNSLSQGMSAVVSNVLGVWLPDGMAIHQSDANGFTANATVGGWREPNALLPGGAVYFVFNPYDVAITLTLVGEVMQGNLRQALPAGHSIAGSLVPQPGRVALDLKLPAEAGDEVWRWLPENQSYRRYGLSPSNGWVPEEPPVSICEAFVVKKQVEALWSRVFFLDDVGCLAPPGPLPRQLMVSAPGQLHFMTYHPNPELGRVDGVGSQYFGQLYAGLSTNEAELSPVGVPERFLDGAQLGYVNGGIVTLPDVPASNVVQVQLRVWAASEGDSYEAALAIDGFTTKSEIVAARTEAPLVDGHPSGPPKPVNHFRTLRPPEMPRFVVEPLDLAVPIGQDAVFAVVSSGAGPMSYQWRCDGLAIPGATGPQLHLDNVQRTNAGNYSVLLKNDYGELSSRNARLAVYEPVRILAQSASNVWYRPGQGVALSVSTTGDGPLTYQWFIGLEPIPFSSGATLSIPSNRIISDRAYSVTVSNDFNVATSGPIWLRQRPSLRIEAGAPGVYRLVWPAQTSEFVLEQRASLAGPEPWAEVSQPVVCSGGQCVVTLESETATNKWFRLHLPE